MSKRLISLGLGISIFLIILSLNYLSAADLCWIQQGSTPSQAVVNCNANLINGVNGSAIMYLSGLTNAHGALLSNPDYSNVLCCAIESGSTSCTGNNKVLGLSSATNAHAERPENTTYTNNVCYVGLLRCYNGPADTTETSIVNLSSITNAHVGNGYTTQISCEYSLPPISCNLNSARWQFTEATNGTQVEMYVDGTNCGGEQISFDVWNGNRLCGVNLTGCTSPDNVFKGDGTVAGRWTANPPSGTNYTFIAKLVNNLSESVTSSGVYGELSVIEAVRRPYCDTVPVTLCQQYTNPIRNSVDGATPNDCNFNFCNITDFQPSFPSDTTIDCSDPGTDCFCSWDATNDSCGAAATYNGCGNGIKEDGEVCDGTKLGGYNCTDFDEYSGGTLLCNADCNGFITAQCTGYSCNNNGVRNTGEACDGTDLGGYNCTAFDKFTGGTLLCNNACDFDTSQCSGAPKTNIGTCVYTADSSDTCDDDGFLTVVWHTRWVGTQGTPEAIQCTSAPPIGDNGLEESILCPASIPLPFFNIYNLLAVVVVIAVIYWMIERKNRRKSK